jgi:excisionase family DNA binding protein
MAETTVRREFWQELDEVLAATPPDELPEAMGALEAARSRALLRLMREAAGGSRAIQTPGRCLRPTAVAELLGLPVTKVYEMLRRRELVARKAGKYWLILAESLERYLRGPRNPKG